MIGKTEVTLPYSKMKKAVADILHKEGYLASVDKAKSGALQVELLYASGKPAIQGIKRISKPSRRLYLGVRDIQPVKRGHGLLVLSTPAGVVSGKEAREKRVGGEVLFEIW